jgi:hypothetical protein
VAVRKALIPETACEVVDETDGSMADYADAEEAADGSGSDRKEYRRTTSVFWWCEQATTG